MKLVPKNRKTAWVFSVVALVVAGFAVYSISAPLQSSAAPHPLDPLTAAELELAAALARSDERVGEGVRFTFIALAEPTKAELSSGSLEAIPRRAEVGAFDRSRNLVQELVVNLDARRVEVWRAVPGAQPPYLEDDDEILRAILDGDRDWQATLRSRDLDDRSLRITGLSLGDHGQDERPGARLVMAIVRVSPDGDEHGGLVPGLAAYVDLTDRRVIQIVDTGGTLPINEPGFVDAADDLTPKMPKWSEGVRHSFVVTGHKVNWGPWAFRFGMHPREGLVLHDVRLRDEQNELRLVLHRASLSEMAVPYGDPDVGWHVRNIFDAGETGMAKYGKTSLMPGIDAPDDALFVDAVVNDEHGRAVPIPKAVAVFERTTSALWRHARHGVPGRELVILSYATIDNYDYGIQWSFKEDGSLTIDMLLTGIMATKAIQAGRDPLTGDLLCGTRVGNYTIAPNHQHFFNFRLDFDVDGPHRNQVTQIEASGRPQGAENPFGNLIASSSRMLQNENEAAQLTDPERGRKWKVANGGSRKTALGQSPGFVIIPGENAVPFAAPDSSFMRRAGFAKRHFWVTPYSPTERYAAGEYPFNGTGDDGLEAWTRQNRPLADGDVVIWYTVGVTHLPRPEEWPVMPVHRASFQIVPSGFFRRNPVLAPDSR